MKISPSLMNNDFYDKVRNLNNQAVFKYSNEGKGDVYMGLFL